MKNNRRDLIRDCVKIYIKNNPVEYMNQLKINKDRRDQLFDKQFGQLKKNNFQIDEDNIRLAFSFPAKLISALDTLLKDSDGRFLEVKGEDTWFAKAYPEFLIPDKY